MKKTYILGAMDSNGNIIHVTGSTARKSATMLRTKYGAVQICLFEVITKHVEYRVHYYRQYYEGVQLDPTFLKTLNLEPKILNHEELINLLPNTEELIHTPDKVVKKTARVILIPTNEPDNRQVISEKNWRSMK